MRAAYANGVLAALEDAGVNSWDAVYGTSAGGALAAWYSAHQANHALETWPYVRDPRILSYKRWLTRRGPLLDHDALFEIVYRTERPMDTDAVRSAPHPVIVPVTHADTGQTHYVDLRDGPVIEWIKAAGRMPLLSGDAVTVEGEPWLDGGLTDAVPMGKALDDGATEVLVVLNRPPQERSPEHRIASWLVDRRYPGLGEYVETHHHDWNTSVALALHPPDGVQVDIIHPQEDLGLNRFTRSIETIEDAAETGRHDGTRYLRQEADTVLPKAPA